MPRFVILQHDHPLLHWDLMLEIDGALKTWRLPAPPNERPTQATSLGEHRLMYLDYEGPLSGNRGAVKRWDAGVYEIRAQNDGAWIIVLHGQRWRGTANLTPRSDAVWDAMFAPAP